MKNIYVCVFVLMAAVWTLPVMAGDMPVVFSVEEAVKEAILQNPGIKETSEYIKGAKQGVKSSRADFFAKTVVNYSYTGLDNQPVMKNANGETATAHTRQYAWDLTISQPLFTGFALSTALDIAKSGVISQKVHKDMVVLDLARDVKMACYNLLLTQKMLVVAESEVNSLKAHKNVALQFYKQELIPKNDLLRSQVALDDSIQTVEKARARVGYARALLNTLMDADVNRMVDVKDIESILPSDHEFAGLSRYAIDHRPVLKELKNNLDQAVFSEKLAKADRYPHIALTGQYGQIGDDFLASDNDYANSHNASICLTVGWTLFQWGKTGAQVRKTLHEQKGAKEKIKQTQNRIRLEIKDALLNLDVAKKNIKTAKKSQGQARENFRITNVQYAQQVVTSDIVLDARSFLTRADTNYYQALYGYMSYLADLHRAMGDS